MIVKHIEIEGCNGRKITLDYRFKESSKPLIPVVYVHGFKGFKDWGASNLIADDFAKKGVLFLKFNFSHNGVNAQNLIDFIDLEAFGSNNYQIELHELGLVIDWLAKLELNIQFDKLTVIGHSRGGGITLLRSAQDSRIFKAITWASVCDFENRFPKDISEWKKLGVHYVLNGRTNQMMPLYFQFYENFLKHKVELNIPMQCKKINQKVLVIHGSEDASVGMHDAHKISSYITNSSKVIVDGTGHTFGAIHPYTNFTLTDDLTQVIRFSADFIFKN